MKMFRAALVILALPAALAAQQPAVGPVTATFQTRTMALQKNLQQAFDSIPASKFSYRPTPAQLTIGYIAQHLASDNTLFCNNFGAMKATISDRQKTTPDSVKATWSKEELMTQLRASFDFCEAAFAQLDDSKMGDQVTLTFGANTRTVTRVSMVLGHTLDMADHYSQISNYMRLNNMLPPTALPRPGRSGGGGR